MVKRTSHKQASCPVARPLDVIGDGWSMLIVRDAFEGLTRFGEFQKSLGLAKNILAARLRNLVEHGVMVAVPAESGSHQEYRLTDKGRALFPLLVAIRQWGEDYFFARTNPMSAWSSATAASRCRACRYAPATAVRSPRKIPGSAGTDRRTNRLPSASVRTPPYRTQATLAR
ncbi:transcriptional regulator [Pseudomonas aeruginosa]|nr:transcriptional regulator [Pseudomonas aeruginosa]